MLDITRAEDVADWLSKRGVLVIDRAQGNAEAAYDYEQWMEGLRNGCLKHTGDNGLRRHVLNAISIQLPRGARRFDRPSQSRAAHKQDLRVVDALTAAAMVNSFTSTQHTGRTVAGSVEDYRIMPLLG